MADMTLIRPLNEGQGHSFGTDRFLIIRLHYRLSIVGLSFALGRTV